MTQFNLIILVIGFLVLFLGVFSGLFKRKGLSEPCIALLAGLLLGQNGFNVLTPETWGESGPILKEASRLTLAIGLMGVALRVPDFIPFKLSKDLLILLLVVMPGMLILSSLVSFGFLGIGVWTALLIGAIVTPTDPVVASSIVTGDVAKKNLPERIRNIISAESGFNDGLGLLFVMLPFLFIENHHAPITHWLTKVLLWEVGAGIALGFILGIGAGKLLLFVEKKQFIEKPSILSFTIALAIFTLALLKLLHSDGILGVFVAGLALNRTISARQRAQEERVTEGIDKFFTLPIFALLGVYLPVDAWIASGWKFFVLAVLILLIKRIPLLLIFWRTMKSIKNIREALFVGWFGPVGVAAIFYANLKTDIQQMDIIWNVVSLVVTASIVLHGLTATFFSRKLSKSGG